MEQADAETYKRRGIDQLQLQNCKFFNVNYFKCLQCFSSFVLSVQTQEI